jgi:hypothetical protein
VLRARRLDGCRAAGVVPADEVEAERNAWVCGFAAATDLIAAAVRSRRPAEMDRLLAELTAELHAEERRLVRAVAEMN